MHVNPSEQAKVKAAIFLSRKETRFEKSEILVIIWGCFYYIEQFGKCEQAFQTVFEIDTYQTQD